MSRKHTSRPKKPERHQPPERPERHKPPPDLVLPRDPAPSAVLDDSELLDSLPQSYTGRNVLFALVALLLLAGLGFGVRAWKGAPRDDGPHRPPKPAAVVDAAVIPDLGLADLDVADLDLTDLAVVDAGAAIADAMVRTGNADAFTAVQLAEYQRYVREGERLAGTDDAEGAMRNFRKALAIRPNGKEALFGMACARIDANENEADKLADRALRADTLNAEAYLAKGAIAQKQKRYNEARTAYRRYLYLAPDGKYAAEIRMVLENLH